MAGTWYPGQPDELRRLLRSYREELPTTPDRLDPATRLAGLVSPHAGYPYSGRCAAKAYAALGSWRPRRVVVVAPSHQEWFPGVSFWSPVEGHPAPGHWSTPLGDVDVELEFGARLARQLPSLHCGQQGHRAEHSLELQLPFLQHALGSFRLVPLVMGDQRPEQVRNLVEALAASLDEIPTLLVASTDLSHFHDVEEAAALDNLFLKTLGSATDETLLTALHSGACDGGPVAVVLGTLRRVLGDVTVDVLDYRTSAEITGDTSSVVGYGSALIRERRNA
jgi:AmmeMemoRadiSam system protein B